MSYLGCICWGHSPYFLSDLVIIPLIRENSECSRGRDQGIEASAHPACQGSCTTCYTHILSIAVSSVHLGDRLSSKPSV